MSGKHTPGPEFIHPTRYTCKKCGWSGWVSGRPRCLPCAAKATSNWRKNNPDKNRNLKQRMDKKTRTERPEIAAARKRRKYANNIEHYRSKYAERLQWLSEGNVTKEQLVNIYMEAQGKCHYCSQPVKPRLTPSDPRGFDHVMPRSKGGKHTVSNLVLCCRNCNERRSDNGEMDPGAVEVVQR